MPDARFIFLSGIQNRSQLTFLPAMMKNRVLLLSLAILIGTACQPARSQSVQIEELKAEILLKLLSQNRSLDSTRIDTVRFAIVYDGRDAGSQSEGENYQRIFSGLPNSPFKNKPIRIERQPNNRLNDLSWEKILAVLIIPGKSDRIPEILRRCAESQVLSMATDSTLIARGVSVAVEIDYKVQPVICFNLNSLDNEGAVYDAKILQLARYMVWK